MNTKGNALNPGGIRKFALWMGHALNTYHAALLRSFFLFLRPHPFRILRISFKGALAFVPHYAQVVYLAEYLRKRQLELTNEQVVVNAALFDVLEHLRDVQKPLPAPSAVPPLPFFFPPYATLTLPHPIPHINAIIPPPLLFLFSTHHTVSPTASQHTHTHLHTEFQTDS